MNHRFVFKLLEIGLDIAFTFSLSEVSHYYPKIVEKFGKVWGKNGTLSKSLLKLQESTWNYLRIIS